VKVKGKKRDGNRHILALLLPPNPTPDRAQWPYEKTMQSTETEFYSPRSTRRVAGTQQIAFHRVTVAKRATQNEIVMAFFENEETLLTRHEIERQAHIPLSSVCRVARELQDAGRLAVRGSVECIYTGHDQQLLGLPTKAQRELFERSKA
jgi:hypothetical protein